MPDMPRRADELLACIEPRSIEGVGEAEGARGRVGEGENAVAIDDPRERSPPHRHHSKEPQFSHQLPVTGTFVRVLKYEKFTLVAKGEI